VMEVPGGLGYAFSIAYPISIVLIAPCKHFDFRPRFSAGRHGIRRSPAMMMDRMGRKIKYRLASEALHYDIFLMVRTSQNSTRAYICEYKQARAGAVRVASASHLL